MTDTAIGRVISLEEVKAGRAELNLTEEGKRLRFALTDEGVFFHGLDKEGKAQAPLKVCSPLSILAQTHDEHSENWGRLLEFADRAGHVHRWAVPMELFKGDGSEVRQELLRLGLIITPGRATANRLNDYIMSEPTAKRITCVMRPGWYRQTYVLPNRTLGSGEVIYQGVGPGAGSFSERGTLEGWRESVAHYCAGNSRLVFAVSCALAAPLLHLLGDESGGFHLRGTSSTGKSTALHIAASVWGGRDFKKLWRATTNGLEGLAQLHNDGLLILDELAQVDAREAGEIAYMLANGGGKQRASVTGAARRQARWRLLFLSSGEISLAQHMAQGGKTIKAGQELRLADIPADAGAGLGVFERLHGVQDGKAFADTLNQSTLEHYGQAGPAFVAMLCRSDDSSTLAKALHQQRDALARSWVSAAASGQVLRIASRMALVAVAGELATAEGLTSWPEGEATHAAKTCFDAWLHGRGGAGNLDETALLNQVRAFIEAHGESRFAELKNNDNRVVSQRAGFRETHVDGERCTFLVLPEAFKEMVRGHDFRWAGQVLCQHGWIAPDSAGKNQQQRRLPDLGKTRVYVLTPPMDAEGAA